MPDTKFNEAYDVMYEVTLMAIVLCYVVFKGVNQLQG